MQIDEEVRAALETLRRHAEGNEIELHRIDVLERALMAPPVVEQVNYINLADNAPTNLVALTKSEHQRVNTGTGGKCFCSSKCFLDFIRIKERRCELCGKMYRPLDSVSFHKIRFDKKMLT